MNTVHKNIVAFSLAFLVVFASSSFSLIKHFCGDEMVYISLYETKDSCCSVQENNSKTPLFSKVSCCSSETETKIALDFEKSDSQTAIAAVTISVFLSQFVWDFTPWELEKVAVIRSNSPPKLKTNLHLVYETLLI